MNREGCGHDRLVARLLPFEGITMVFSTAILTLGGSAKRDHDNAAHELPDLAALVLFSRFPKRLSPAISRRQSWAQTGSSQDQG